MDRTSARLRAMTDGPWRSVIRIFAVVIAVVGLAFILNELVENITSCNAGGCSRIHLGSMLTGVGLMAFGLLILQKGDVSLSLKEAVESGSIVRDWFTRAGRKTDAPGTKVITGVAPPTSAPQADPDKP